MGGSIDEVRVESSALKLRAFLLLLLFRLSTFGGWMDGWMYGH